MISGILAYILVGGLCWAFGVLGLVAFDESDHGLFSQYPYLISLILLLGWPLVIPSVILGLICYALYRATKEIQLLWSRLSGKAL